MKPEVSVPWYRSLTVWVGLVAILAAALQQFAGLIPGTVASEKALAVAGVLTILLRLTSSKPIQGTPKESSRIDEVAGLAEDAVRKTVLKPQEPGQAGVHAAKANRSTIAAEVAEEVRKTIKRSGGRS
jgi:hypothetical protein